MSTFGKLATLGVLGPLASLVLGIGGCEATKAYYDWRVREMCEKDGGVTVYERVPIRKDLFTQLGGDLGGDLAVPSEEPARPDMPVFSRHKHSVVKAGEPSISRYESNIVRRSDGKLVGRFVSYARGGGDFPFTGSHPSSFSCPSGSDSLFVRRILYVEGEMK